MVNFLSCPGCPWLVVTLDGQQVGLVFPEYFGGGWGARKIAGTDAIGRHYPTREDAAAGLVAAALYPLV